jgi:hypothetical protein
LRYAVGHTGESAEPPQPAFDRLGRRVSPVVDQTFHARHSPILRRDPVS